MTDYIFSPLETDPDRLAQEAFDFLQTRWPDWEPNEGNLETWLILAMSRMIAEARDVGSDVPAAIFRTAGRTLFNVDPIDALSSTVGSVWTMEDDAGYMIPADTLAAVIDADDAVVPFGLVSDLTIAPGDTTASGVLLRSQEQGASTSGLGEPGLSVDLINERRGVLSVTLEYVTEGGQDAESDDDYIDRLASYLQLLSPTPIVPRDFELMAMDIAKQEGSPVRALAIDGYNPADSTMNNDKMVYVVVVDAGTGLNTSGPLRTTIDARLQTLRETNFIVNVGNPTRTTVDVTFVGVASLGADPAAVEAAAEAAVTAFLSPVNHGRPQSEDDEWINTTVIRLQDVSTVLNNVVGFDHWTTLTIGLNGGAQTSADHALTGTAPISDPGAVAGTVS